MKIVNSVKNTIIAENCRVADTFLSRFRGLMGEKALPKDCGLLIVPCNSIHMFFMKFPLDLVFIDGSNTVLHTVEGIKPWRVSKIVPGARGVLELPVGAISASGTQKGDILSLVE